MISVESVFILPICFLIQIANHSGYVQVDWKKVEKDVNKAKKHLKKKANKAAPEINTFIEEVKVPVTKLALFFTLELISNYILIMLIIQPML